jgi:hypothetical protein
MIRSDASMSVRCTHLDEVRADTPNGNGCEECLAVGDTWVHLRLCRTCGYVGCCASSKNKHAIWHFHATRHPIMTSLEPGENWSWCFVDRRGLQLERPVTRIARHRGPAANASGQISESSGPIPRWGDR